jgi:hypothetical protein
VDEQQHRAFDIDRRLSGRRRASERVQCKVVVERETVEPDARVDAMLDQPGQTTRGEFGSVLLVETHGEEAPGTHRPIRHAARFAAKRQGKRNDVGIVPGTDRRARRRVGWKVALQLVEGGVENDAAFQLDLHQPVFRDLAFDRRRGRAARRAGRVGLLDLQAQRPVAEAARRDVLRLAGDVNLALRRCGFPGTGHGGCLVVSDRVGNQASGSRNAASSLALRPSSCGTWSKSSRFASQRQDMRACSSRYADLALRRFSAATLVSAYVSAPL